MLYTYTNFSKLLLLYCHSCCYGGGGSGDDNNDNNNNNENLERLTRTGPKRLHVLYKYLYIW